MLIILCMIKMLGKVDGIAGNMYLDRKIETIEKFLESDQDRFLFLFGLEHEIHRDDFKYGQFCFALVNYLMFDPLNINKLLENFIHDFDFWISQIVPAVLHFIPAVKEHEKAGETTNE